MDTHASTQSLLPLQEPPTDGRTLLNGSVWFVDSDGYRVVFRWHEPLYRVALTNEVHLRLVAVSLRQSQLATQEEICRAFGHDVSTQARWERQYRKHGIDGLVPKKSALAALRSWTRAKRDSFAAGSVQEYRTAKWPNGWELASPQSAAPCSAWDWRTRRRRFRRCCRPWKTPSPRLRLPEGKCPQPPR